MTVSISKKVAAYIQAHPELRGESREKVISVICSECNISEEDAKKALGASVFYYYNEKLSENIDSITIGENSLSTKADETDEEKNKTLSEIVLERLNNTSKALQTAEESNGFIGEAWSKIKNKFNFGDSSNKVREAQSAEYSLVSQLDGENASEAFKELTGLEYTDENIEKFKTGEIRLKSEKNLDGYKEGQKMAVDITENTVSGIAAAAAFAGAITAAPVTGGTSIAFGLAIAGAAGAAVKSGLKALDTKIGARMKESEEVVFDYAEENTEEQFPDEAVTGISSNAINLIKKFEGCRLEAYKCPTGRWTIGYGHTGQDVVSGTKITKQEAEELLKQDLTFHYNSVAELVKVKLNQNQMDALVSFEYNLGRSTFKNSTLLKLLNEGDYEGAAEQFERWKFAGGKILAGLEKRRKAEKKLFTGS